METQTEVERLRDYILFLEGENASLSAKCADLEDELEAMNVTLNRPSYD